MALCQVASERAESPIWRKDVFGRKGVSRIHSKTEKLEILRSDKVQRILEKDMAQI